MAEKEKDPKVLETMALAYKKEVDVGYPGIVRGIEFNKLMLDKDFVWKLEIILKTPIDDLEMMYDCAIVLDPETYNKQINNLWNEANSKQTSIEHINTAHLSDSLKRIHDSYREDASSFAEVSFQARVLKFEKKSKGSLVQLLIQPTDAQKISKLHYGFEKAAIVLGEYSGKPEKKNEE